jgi:glycine/D-amino acid oxidase-like deaminating enzyme
LSSSPPEVAVIGAGVFGAAAALELRRRGREVVLVDQGSLPHPDASSTDMSKMIRMDYGSDRFYHELAEASLDRWDRWNEAWARPLYHDEGFLVLAAGPMEPGGFEYESRRLLMERGYAAERIGGVSLVERYPRWSGDAYADGYLSPRGGWAESGAVVGWLLDECRTAGVRFLDARFQGLRMRASTVEGIRLDAGGTEELLDVPEVVVCAGAWTPKLLPWTGGLLRTVAQPVVHFGVAEPDEFRGKTFPPFAADIAGSGWYGFPALDDGRLKLGHHGPGRRVHPDERGTVSPDHLLAARAFLARSLPSLADAPVVGTRVCLYCDSRDGDLLIDRDPRHVGLVVAAGGSGHAFKFAPLLGEMIADAVDRRPNRWLSRFAWREAGKERTEEARYQ